MSELLMGERHDFPARSHLFMVRVWLEDLGNGKTEWRGKLQCVATGEVKYFREWHTLIAGLTEMLPVANLKGA